MVIEVHNLVKRYKDLIAVDNVNFGIGKGGFLDFWGQTARGRRRP